MLRSHHPRTTLIASAIGCLALAGMAVAQTQPATPAQAPDPRLLGLGDANAVDGP